MANTGHEKTRVLYLFLGINRKALLERVTAGSEPDTALRGLNHVRDRANIESEHLDVQDVPAWMVRVMPFQLLPFLHVRRVLASDVVIASDAVIFGYVVSLLSRIRRRPVHWVYIAINSSVLMRRHAHDRFRSYLLALCWKSYARIIYLSEAQRRDFQRIGVADTKLKRVPFGVDVGFWAHAGTAPGEELIVSVGRDLGRDHRSLLVALQKVPYRAIIATSPKNIPINAAVPGSVDVRYNVTPGEVRELYARATVVVVILKEDGAPDGSDCTGQTVILEALAAGKAVVATRRAWLDEYFTEGKEYLAVEPYDSDGIVHTLQMLMQDRELRARLGEAGRARVSAAYTTTAFAAGLANVVQDVATSL